MKECIGYVILLHALQQFHRVCAAITGGDNGKIWTNLMAYITQVTLSPQPFRQSWRRRYAEVRMETGVSPITFQKCDRFVSIFGQHICDHHRDKCLPLADNRTRNPQTLDLCLIAEKD